ncbi:Long-chain-fatty-acid--CoA ligase [Stanieria cyanosphaera PCC 7437]|uniref:Long-chain-fatty-acid--CoA ligase n=1 Tax=Stanieria cyanosphaera (strain ATCC 29371 / PCC 7437) TaxID=111780 RepID=K9XUF5_STAC7|nr:fatty acyl-AMP ligase [Stanieria cyanosphaera]AFZ35711.1 Long-chain-fatty-acid--CoA ligase [Stanieria cyanosphaera PCC 7437]
MTNHSNLVDLLNYRALDRPNQIAYRFLKDSKTESALLTYAELDCQAKAIAAKLQSLVPAGSRALLVYSYDAGLEFIAAFFGCLYAEVIAVTTTPPRHGKEIAKLQQRAIASGATIVLTTKDFLTLFESQLEHTGFNCLATDDLTNDLAQDWMQPKINEDTLAFLQYTSGSTGIPKGVMVTHGNILCNEEMIKQAFQHTKDTVVVGWLPMYHDMGLIGNVLQPVYLGTESILMSPIALSQQPLNWLKAITQYQATTSGGPNFAYDLLCLRATEEQLAELDLSSWQVAFSGAEPVRAETIERFSSIFAACGFRSKAFYPCYGMAETTLFVSGGLQTAPPQIKYVDGIALAQNRVMEVTPEQSGVRAIVGCGKNWLDTEIIIVNPESLTKCSDKQVGEIWVSGSGIGKGYWEQPEETQQTFQAYLATGEGPFLRTGDLGFFQDGELYITGRLKEVMIFWGRYCYPQHVERTVQESHPAFRLNCGAAFAVETGTAEKLVIVQEIERSYLRNLNAEELVNTICQAVGKEHEVEVSAIALIKTGSIPKTSSGKIQRRLCQTMFLKSSLNTVAVWQPEVIAKTVTEMVDF